MNYESEQIQKIDFSSKKEGELNKDAIYSEIMDMAKWTGAELSEQELRVCLEGTPSLRPDLSNEEKESRKIPQWLASRFLWLKGRADDAHNEEEKSKIGAQALVIKAAEYLFAAPWASAQCLALAHRVRDQQLEWEDVEIPDADKIMMDEETAQSIKDRKIQEVREKRKVA